MDKITHTPTPIWICKKCFGQFTENVNPHTKAEWFASGRVFSPDTDVCDNPLERYISLDELHKQIGMGFTHWLELKTINNGLVVAARACLSRLDGEKYYTDDELRLMLKESLKAADGEEK